MQSLALERTSTTGVHMSSSATAHSTLATSSTKLRFRLLSAISLAPRSVDRSSKTGPSFLEITKVFDNRWDLLLLVRCLLQQRGRRPVLQLSLISFSIHFRMDPRQQAA